MLATLGLAGCDISADDELGSDTSDAADVGDDAFDTYTTDGVGLNLGRISSGSTNAKLGASEPAQAPQLGDSAAASRLAFVAGLAKVLPSPKTPSAPETPAVAADPVPTSSLSVASISRPMIGVGAGAASSAYGVSPHVVRSMPATDIAPPNDITYPTDEGDGEHEGCPAQGSELLQPASEEPERDRQFQMFQGQVVVEGEPDDAIFHPGFESVHDAPNYSSRRVVRDESLAPSTAAWRGVQLIAYGTQGEVCRGWITSFQGGSFYVEHPWDWSEETNTLRPVVAPGPEAVWNRGKRYLLGELVVTSGDCKDALYAVHAEGPSRVPFEAVSISSSLRAKALAAFGTTADWAEVQEHHASTMAASLPKAPVKRWDSVHSAEYYEEGPVHRVQAYLDAATKRRFVVVSSNTGGECGSPGGSLSSVFAVKHTKAGTRLSALYGMQFAESISGLVDLNGDGSPDAMLPWEEAGVLSAPTPDDLHGEMLLERAVAPDVGLEGCRC